MSQMKPLFGTPLNRAHPLSQGLVGCWLFNEGSGLAAYDSSGFGYDALFHADSSIFPTWVKGTYGSAVGFVDNGDYVQTNSGFVGLQDYSVVYGYVATSLNGGSYVLLGKIDITSFYADNNNSGVRVINGNLSVTTPANGVFGTPMTATGTPQSFAVTRAVTAVSAFSNGSLNATAVASTASATATMQLGTVIGGRDLLGYVDYQYIYNRALSAPEISYLNAFPYCMFDPNVAFDPATENTLIVTGSLL